MATETLAVNLPSEIYQRFIQSVAGENGKWKGRGSFPKAIDAAVTAALVIFLREIKKETALPEFRAYASEKYPELNEYFIRLIEDLIENGKRLKS